MSGGYFLEPVQTSGLAATLTASIKCAVVSRQRLQHWYNLVTRYNLRLWATTNGCKPSLCQKLENTGCWQSFDSSTS
jgi:hypothetical protein